MQNAYRTIQRLEGSQVMVDLPVDFPRHCTAEIIVFPLEESYDSVKKYQMREWLSQVWGCVPDFPGRTEQLPVDDVIPL